MKIPKSPHLIPKYWFGVWLVFYLTLIITSIFYPESTFLDVIKVLSILLCALYSFITFPKDHLLHTAMMVTFIADYLLAGNNTSIVGLTVFFLAQCFHLYRLLATTKAQPRVILLVGLCFIAMALNLFLQLIPAIFIIGGFYAFTLISNIITSWRWRKAQPQNFYAWCAIFGFILFACCDLCTGISYLSLTAVIPAFLYAPANFLAWVFYYPSQILVSNSSKCATIETKEGKC